MRLRKRREMPVLPHCRSTLLKNSIQAESIYNLVLISDTQQCVSVTGMYILFHVLFHYGLSPGRECRPLGSTAGPRSVCDLSPPVCICSSHPPSPPPAFSISPFLSVSLTELVFTEQMNK